MDLNLFTLGGYGQFVWPAFIFTFLICFYLFLKTKKELRRQEKLFFNEFKQLQTIKIVVNSQKEKTRKVLSSNSAF
tara:strand:+ start:1405 stop:1632 length:228 start_codon:yes stop_codon:yes gene_type:complete